MNYKYPYIIFADYCTYFRCTMFHITNPAQNLHSFEWKLVTACLVLLYIITHQFLSDHKTDNKRLYLSKGFRMVCQNKFSLLLF
jgi:hypothetical protein